MIRPARPDDVPEILSLVRELASYERAPDAVRATPDDLHAALFADHPAVFALIAEHEADEADGADGAAQDDDGAGSPANGSPANGSPANGSKPGRRQIAGFALWFLNFSTWLGRHGIYLEDLYVRPQFRGKGYGRELLTELGRIANERGYGRLEWWVLDWNEPAHRFYRSLGATPMDEWTVWRVADEALLRLRPQPDVDPTVP